MRTRIKIEEDTAKQLNDKKWRRKSQNRIESEAK